MDVSGPFTSGPFTAVLKAIMVFLEFDTPPLSKVQMPPPSRAELPVTVVLVIVRTPSKKPVLWFLIPPPRLPELAEMVLLVIVALPPL